MTHITETEFTALVKASTSMHDRIQQLEDALNKVWQLSLVAQAEIDDGADDSEAMETLIKIAEVAAAAVEPDA
jgi:predicted  nucleic acid-binding Zn-ribbon protein